MSRLFRNFFYRQPSRQAGTACLHPPAATAELWMRFPQQPGNFTNWRKDPLAIDFGLTGYIVFNVHRGREAAQEDTIHKRGWRCV
jgi:hypothetical protein